MLKLDNTEKNDMNVSTPCSESISHNVAMIESIFSAAIIGTT